MAVKEERALRTLEQSSSRDWNSRQSEVYRVWLRSGAMRLPGPLCPKIGMRRWGARRKAVGIERSASDIHRPVARGRRLTSRGAQKFQRLVVRGRNNETAHGKEMRLGAAPSAGAMGQCHEAPSFNSEHNAGMSLQYRTSPFLQARPPAPKTRLRRWEARHRRVDIKPTDSNIHWPIGCDRLRMIDALA